MSESKSQDPSGQLVLCSTDQPHESTNCLKLLSTNDNSPDYVLFISFGPTPDDLLERLPSHSTECPKSIGILAANDSFRSASTDTPSGGDPLTAKCTIRTVSPTNLTEVGVRFTEFLKQWEFDDKQIAVCFDSITLLAQYVDQKTLIKFLHVFSGHIRSAGATAHFHLNPSAVDEKTTAMIKTTVDEVVSPSNMSDISSK